MVDCIPTTATVIGGPWPYVIAVMLFSLGFIVRGFVAPAPEATQPRRTMSVFLEDQLELQRAISNDVYLMVMERVRAHKETLPINASREANPFYATDLEGRAILEQAVAIRKRARVPHHNLEAAYEDWLLGIGDRFYLYGFPVLRAANQKVGI